MVIYFVTLNLNSTEADSFFTEGGKSLIKFERVSKVYEDGFQALKDVNIQFEEGKINVLIGPSGCGKTTTMKLLNRLIDYSDGNITFDGKNIGEMNPIDLRRQMGYVIQNIGLFPHMTIYENVATVPKLLKWDKKRINKRVDELLELVNLDPKQYRNRYPSELSGGQQQRIGVIRALAAEPSTILMDEPFSALDPISREQLQNELIRLQQTIKKTFIFVTHDMDEALKIADRIILMKDGQVVQEGSPKDIVRNPKNDFVKEFIGVNRLKNNSPIPQLDDFLQKEFSYAKATETDEHAIERMMKARLSYLPVLEEAKKYVGVVNLFTLLEKKECAINEVIDHTADVIINTEPINQIIMKAEQSKLTYIPVLKEDQTMVGLLDKNQIIHTLRTRCEF